MITGFIKCPRIILRLVLGSYNLLVSDSVIWSSSSSIVFFLLFIFISRKNETCELFQLLIYSHFAETIEIGKEKKKAHVNFLIFLELSLSYIRLGYTHHQEIITCQVYRRHSIFKGLERLSVLLIKEFYQVSFMDEAPSESWWS